MEASATTVTGGRSALERSPAGRLPDRRLKWGLTALAAAILVLIVYFFIRLIGESHTVFSTVRAELRVRQRLGRQRATSTTACAMLFGTLVTSSDRADHRRAGRGRRPPLFINELCPRRLRRPLSILVDLLAAVPSVVYGLWGVFVLAPKLLAGREVVREHVLVHPLDRRRHADRSTTTSSPG